MIDEKRNNCCTELLNTVKKSSLLAAQITNSFLNSRISASHDKSDELSANAMVKFLLR